MTSHLLRHFQAESCFQGHTGIQAASVDRTLVFSLSRGHLMLNTMHRKQESHINSCHYWTLATLHPIFCWVLCLLQVVFFLVDWESRVHIEERRKAEGRQKEGWICKVAEKAINIQFSINFLNDHAQTHI